MYYEPLHNLCYQYQWTTIIIYGLAMTFIALSTLSQYLRFLFRREYRILCWVLIAINASFGIVALFVDIFTCRPISYFYNKFTPGKCINMTAWWYFATVYIAIMCVIVVIIPIIALKDLQLPRSQKRALIGVFALGGLYVPHTLRQYCAHIALTTEQIMHHVMSWTIRHPPCGELSQLSARQCCTRVLGVFGDESCDCLHFLAVTQGLVRTCYTEREIKSRRKQVQSFGLVAFEYGSSTTNQVEPNRNYCPKNRARSLRDSLNIDLL